MICGLKVRNLTKLANLVTPRKPTIGNYIIESLLDKNINTVFGHYKFGPYSPFYKYEKEYEDFDIVFDNYVHNCGYNALTYSKINNNMGVIVSTSTTGLGNLIPYIKTANQEMRPILLLSFFDPDSELKISPFPGTTKSFIKESLTIKVPENFSTDMEDLLSYSFIFPAGPVHLNVSNKILDEPINFKPVKTNEMVKLPTKKRASYPNIKSSNDTCNMYILNQEKMKNNWRINKHKKY